MYNFGYKKKFSKHIILVLQNFTTFLSVAFLTYFHFKINVNNKPLTLHKSSFYNEILIITVIYLFIFFNNF